MNRAKPPCASQPPGLAEPMEVGPEGRRAWGECGVTGRHLTCSIVTVMGRALEVWKAECVFCNKSWPLWPNITKLYGWLQEWLHIRLTTFGANLINFHVTWCFCVYSAPYWPICAKFGTEPLVHLGNKLLEFDFDRFYFDKYMKQYMFFRLLEKNGCL